MLRVPLRKLVVELRFKPELGFYAKMDAVGLTLAGDFPDWERSPLTLEIRNRKKHRRLFLSVKRAFYEVDGADPAAEFPFAENLLEKVGTQLSLKTLARIGVRQWFAGNLDKPFALMVDEFAERFFVRSGNLAGILTDKVNDVGYVVDYKTSDGWDYKLRMGPMMKSQWFSVVAYEPNQFERPDESDAESFEKYRSSIPDQFVYIDIDCYQEEQPIERLGKFLAAARRRSHELASKLLDFCKK